jgi:hypothetical protein
LGLIPLTPYQQAVPRSVNGNLRTVKRRGDTCMEIFTSRIEGIDPFNDKIAPRTVPMVGRPYQCK